jgi:hypothetical protein
VAAMLPHARPSMSPKTIKANPDITNQLIFLLILSFPEFIYNYALRNMPCAMCFAQLL